jgi:RimJ/RimL family protein N-acetyltransferase
VPVVRLPIETERLLIRPLRLADTEPLHELFSDWEAMRHLVPAALETVAESRAWVRAKVELFARSDGMSMWALVERETGEVVGDVGLQWEELDGERVADLGCRLRRRSWGRGYATEACRAVLDAVGRDAPGLRVVAMTAVANGRARRALARLGGRPVSELERYGERMAVYELRAGGRLPKPPVRAARRDG